MSQAVPRALEDYLETILELAEARDAVRVRDIAEARGVKPGSVSPALGRLAALGLIDYTRREFIGLTPAGREVARRVAERHRVLGRLLGEILRLPSADAEPAACAMEHALTPLALGRLARFLTFLDATPERRALVEDFHASLREPGEG